MVVLLPVCVPCINGNHTSHDNDGKAYTHDDWDAFDCKATSDDGQEQCMCRANSPGPCYGYVPTPEAV